MTNKEKQPFKPYVTLEQIYNFDRTQPETSTGSPLVDTVLALFDEPGFHTGAAIANYLELDLEDISAYLLIATGHKLADLRHIWTLNKYEQLKHQYASNDQLAQALGFRDHSSLWHFLHADEQNCKQNAHRHKIKREMFEDLRREYQSRRTTNDE